MFAHSNSPLFREVITSPHGQDSQFLSNLLPLLVPHNYNHEFPNLHPWCLFLNQSHLQLPLPFCYCPLCYSIPVPGEYYSPCILVALTDQSDQGTILAKSQAPQYSSSFQSLHLKSKVPMPSLLNLEWVLGLQFSNCGPGLGTEASASWGTV